MEYVEAKTIVTTSKGTSWFGTQYNMNIYRGCSHGCIYCDSRSDCYKVKDFDTVKIKKNALEIIRSDLRRKVKRGVVATGAMSDPYNPVEKKENLTRNALELINAFGFGSSIATKSSLITRDIDILKDIKEHSPVIAKISITTPHDEISKITEPYVSSSSERFRTIKELSSNGIFTGVLLMPVLPFINDSIDDIMQIVNFAKKNGARFVYPAFGVTLRDNQREYFYEKLEKFYPGLKDKYIRLYKNNYSCSSPMAKELYKAFKEECEKIGMIYKMSDIIKNYKLGYDSDQLTFF